MLESETRTANGWPTVHTDRLIWGEEGSAKEDATLLGCCVVKQLRGFFLFFFFLFFWGGDLWCLAGGMRINDGCIVYVRQTCWVCSNPTERAKKSRGALTSPGNSSPCWGSAFSSSSSRHRWPGVWNRSLKCLLEVVFFSHWSIFLCTLSLMLNCFKKHAGPCEYYQSLYHIESKQ